MQSTGGPAETLQVLTFVFSGSTVLLGFRIVYQAGQLVQTLKEHGRRIAIIEGRCIGGKQPAECVGE
jgi:hypothetical protein